MKVKYQKPAAEQYRDYLAEKVDHGSEDALKELRRQRIEHVTEDKTPNRYRPHPKAERQNVMPIMPHMTYIVARNPVPAKTTTHGTTAETWDDDRHRKRSYCKYMTKFIEKSRRPRPTSEAERQWIDEQGHFGTRSFAYPGKNMPTNNVFSLAYYRDSITIIPPFRYDEEKRDYVQDEEET